MSYFRENWPPQARKDLQRHWSEEKRARWDATHGEWCAKVDRYYAELDERRKASYKPSPAFSQPAEPDGEDPECE
jgi:hypothetical protein